ncbi:MAG: hypothetical protein GTO24_15400 [candidate division Zixibacteria bacterium]|nr:hypothetical protein [candidate division Zixibacteria bacterium]
MKFKVDENLPVEISELLRQAGHDATTILEQDLSGVSDSDIAAFCQRERRVFLTLDTGFADIRAYPPEEFSGLVVLRLKRQDKPYILEIFARLIQIFPTEPLEGHLWIVEEGRIRISG